MSTFQMSANFTNELVKIFQKIAQDKKIEFKQDNL